MNSDSFKFASVACDAAETAAAAQDVAEGLRAAMDTGETDLLLYFVTPPHINQFERIVQTLHDALSPRVSLGLTVQGVLGGGRELERRPAISALAARMAGTWIKPFSYDDIEWPRNEADSRRLHRLFMHEDQEPHAIFLMADPFSTSLGKLLPVLNEAAPGVPIIGGLASGGKHPGDNRLALNGQVRVDGAIGMAVGGAVEVTTTVSQGCRPIGKPWIITRSQHNVIHELGGRPVIGVLQETINQAPAAEHDLLRKGVFVGRLTNEYKPRFGRGDFLIRNILHADEDAGYIAISDLVRTGQTIQFHVRDHRTAEEDLRMLLDSQKLSGPAAGAFLATCNGRGSHLFGTPDKETRIILEALGSVPLAGFFAAGEIGPIGTQNHLHGFTSCLAVFRPGHAAPTPDEEV